MENYITVNLTLDEFKDTIRDVVTDCFNENETNKQETQDEILTRDDVSKLFNISETTIWKYMKDGRLPFRKIGRRVLFSKTEILEATGLDNKSRRDK